MKIAKKLLWVVLAVVVLITGLSGLLAVQTEARLLDADVRRDHRHLSGALAAAASREVERDGIEAAYDVVAAAHSDHAGVTFRVVGPAEAAASGVSAPGDAALTRETQDHYVTLAPLACSRCGGFAVEVAELREPIDRHLRSLVWRQVVLLTLLALVVGAVLVAFTVRSVARPLHELVRHAKRIGGGELVPLSIRLPDDEIGELGEALDEMSADLGRTRERAEAEHARRLATVEQLQHADRLTTVGQLASGLAHELGTPLSVVQGRAQLIADDVVVPDGARRGARVIGEQTVRMAGIIRQLLDFARRGPPVRARRALRDLALRTCGLLEAMAAKRNVHLHVEEGGDDVFADVDAALVEQVLANLVLNAIHASRDGGTIRLAVHGADEPRACIVVTDEGCGIEPAHLRRIFEPFFTTKEVGEGTGLGLSVAHGIVEDHGGALEVDSEVGRGTRFRVFFPST